jgi:hypothetical protein
MKVLSLRLSQTVILSALLVTVAPPSLWPKVCSQGPWAAQAGEPVIASVAAVISASWDVL